MVQLTRFTAQFQTWRDNSTVKQGWQSLALALLVVRPPTVSREGLKFYPWTFFFLSFLWFDCIGINKAIGHEAKARELKAKDLQHRSRPDQGQGQANANASLLRYETKLKLVTSLTYCIT